MDLPRCTTILFDAGDTLIGLRPSLKTVLIDFCTTVLDIADPERSANDFLAAAELWEGIQRNREAKGAPKMASPDLFRKKYFTGLQAVLPRKESTQLEDLYEQLRKRFKGLEWVALPEASAVLESLRSSGYALGVVSNFSPNLPEILEAEGLKKYFATIVVSSIVKAWKPDPKIMAIATADLNIPAEECAYVGDNPFDVQCAKDAGMKAVWLNHYYREIPDEVAHKPDRVIRRLGELKEEDHGRIINGQK